MLESEINFEGNTNNIQAACYVRLSQEDGEKDESDGIRNQKQMIHQFALKNQIQIVDEYVDDGFSGSNYDRPGFKRLIEDIGKGKINCIIVKDLSRLGRNYIETGRYIEQIFPTLGVRFIAINDHYDSNEKGNDAEHFIVPIKNLINDAYCRDISIKVRSQLETRRRSGKFVGCFTPYGYIKDTQNKGKLIIDEPAAEVVRMIFHLRMTGMNHQNIANKLNEMDIPSPGEYKKICGSNFKGGFCMKEKNTWSSSTIRRILKDEIYIGNLVQGKIRKINYKVNRYHEVKEEDWIRVDATHDAIVSKNVFEIVQRLSKMDTRTAPNHSSVYLFSGVLKCGDCGQNMTRRETTKKGKKYYYYHCSTSKKKEGCSSHIISEKKIIESTLEIIQTQIELIVDAEKILKSIEDLPNKQVIIKNIDKQLIQFEKELDRYKDLKERVYVDKYEGFLDEEEYVYMKERFDAKIKDLKTKIQAIIERKEKKISDYSLHQPWIEQFKKYKNIHSLNREIIVGLFERIVVYDSKHIEYVFRYQDELDALLELTNELDGGQ